MNYNMADRDFYYPSREELLKYRVLATTLTSAGRYIELNPSRIVRVIDKSQCWIYLNIYIPIFFYLVTSGIGHFLYKVKIKHISNKT